MIFEGISKASKVLQKNVVKSAFLFALLGSCFVGQAELSAAMSVATQSVPIRGAYFLESSYLGVTSQNVILKTLFSGRIQWRLAPTPSSIVGLQTAFHRFGFINGKGEIDTYDAQFGTHYWTSGVQKLRLFKLGYPTVFALSNDQKWAYLIDFYTGYTLAQIPFPSQVGTVTEIQLSDSGDSIWVTPTHRLTLTQTNEWRIKKVTHVTLAPTEDSLLWSGPLLFTTPQTPIFAMGRDSHRVHYSGALIAIKPVQQSRISTWILDRQLIIEVAPNFNLIRIYDHPSLALILEWKSPDPDEVWTDIWYDNQLLAIRNQSNILSIWNGKTQTFIGSTPYPFNHRDLIGMNAVSDVISLVTRSQTAFALIRK